MEDVSLIVRNEILGFDKIRNNDVPFQKIGPAAAFSVKFLTRDRKART